MNILRRFAAFPCDLNHRHYGTALLILAAALCVSRAAGAVNLLSNPNFELNSGHNIAKGWTRFAPPTAQPFGNYWVESTNLAPAQSGLLFWKEWGASYNGTNNAAGIYQDFGAVPGNTYQASGWFYVNPGDADLNNPDSYAWIEVLFLGSSSNLLALYKSGNFSANVGTSNWFFYGISNACNIASPVSIGDPFFNTYAITGTVSQIVAPAGAAKVRYRFVYVQVASDGGSIYFDTAVLNQTGGPIPPFIASIYPQNMIFVPPGSSMSFNAYSLSGFGISNYNVGLFLNGSNASSGLVVTGSSSNRTVTYSGLQSNTVYNASITVTDSFGLTASASSYFETTWVGVPPVLYLWEAEDYDFNGGQFINNPTLCASNGSPTCYFGKIGTPDTDYHYVSVAPTRLYRANDLIGTLFSGDYDRPDHYFAGVYDYRIDPMNTGSPNQWMNYTHNWPSNTYWAIGRVSTDIGLSGSITLSTVDSGGNPTDIGTFSVNSGLGYSTFENVFLKDTSGNNALLFLNGKQTLRLTAGGNLLPNFVMLVGAIADQPFISGLYPTGTRPFEYTNALSFSVTTRGSSFPAGGIRMTLDGFDVTSNLVISGATATNKSVLLPALLPNATHLAIITITNALGHGIAITNNFDTFNETNIMVEMEDYDFGGGQFITFEDWFPDVYTDVACGCPAAVTNVDFHHTPLSGESGLPNPPYRAVGLPQDKLNISEDYIRANWVSHGAFEWFLAFFAGGDWGNYTRDYPPGSYYAYIRTSGDGPFFLSLDQVVSGVGTLNQTTSHFGTFGGIGKNYTTFAWVPLTDDGLAAPAVVKLTGTNTLRVTTGGNCNPNYFMLIPAAGIRLTATRSAGNTVVSFPTQSGVGYRVFYRTNLSAGSWTLLSNVLGNGTTKSVNDPVGGAGAVRFYKVTAP